MHLSESFLNFIISARIIVFPSFYTALWSQSLWYFFFCIHCKFLSVWHSIDMLAFFVRSLFSVLWCFSHELLTHLVDIKFNQKWIETDFKYIFFYFTRTPSNNSVLNLALSQLHASAHITAIMCNCVQFIFHSTPFHLQHIYDGLLVSYLFLSFNKQFNWTFTLFGSKISHDRLLFFSFQFWPRDLNIFGLLALFNSQRGNDESTADMIINFFLFLFQFNILNRHGSFVWTGGY